MRRFWRSVQGSQLARGEGLVWSGHRERSWTPTVRQTAGGGELRAELGEKRWVPVSTTTTNSEGTTAAAEMQLSGGAQTSSKQTRVLS